MYCVVGLGNPGLDYTMNRHNIGFMVADELIRRYGTGSIEKKYTSEIVLCKVDQHQFFVQKPMTYMNRSGISTAGLTSFYKIAPEKVIVIHDDLDIEPFRIKVKQAGGHGGHNGLKSLDAHIGKNYIRIRMGIGHPGDKDLVTPWVLGNFPKSDHNKIQDISELVAVSVPSYFQDGLNGLRTKIASENK